MCLCILFYRPLSKASNKVIHWNLSFIKCKRLYQLEKVLSGEQPVPYRVFRVSVGYKGKQQTYGDENDSGMAMYTITKNIGLCFLGRYGGMCLNCILHMVTTKEAAIR